MSVKKELPLSADIASLRQKAAKRLNRVAPKSETVSERDAQRLLHELEVHQVELEIQNEELRAARVEVETALERYTEVFLFAPIGYAILALDGTIREINHMGARLLGRESSRLVGARFRGLIAPEDASQIGELLAAAHRTGADGKETSEVQLGHGEPPIRVHLTATALSRAEPVTLLAFEDITERISREAKLARAEEALREVDRRKNDFLAVLSHELRNPMGPIKSSLFVLTRADPMSEQAQHARAIIDRQVTHLTRLIDDLLDVARIARGKIHLQREHVDLGDLVRRTMDDHRAEFDASGVRLGERLEPGPHWVDVDPSRLTQAISNLLGNAEKFTPRGGSVVVTLWSQDNDVAVSVRDTGTGIAPEVLAHLFEPFMQAPQTVERSRGGLGLGLAMVRGLIELHGGKVSISSQGPGCGTEITAVLPSSDPPTVVEAPRQSNVTDGRRVLVIEDNRDAATSLKYLLELSGHDVQIAHDGKAGLELAMRFRPEVVICDIGLPRMDGYAVAKAFRACQALHEAYLIALSGYAQPEDLQRAADAGFNEHVAKPASIEKLDSIFAQTALRH